MEHSWFIHGEEEIRAGLTWPGELWPHTHIAGSECTVWETREVSANGFVEVRGTVFSRGIIEPVLYLDARVGAVQPLNVRPEAHLPGEVNGRMYAEAAQVIVWERVDQSRDSKTTFSEREVTSSRQVRGYSPACTSLG